jgi:hypothetical protein
MKKTILYLETLGKTANLSYDFYVGKMSDIEFSKKGLEIARSVEHELSNRMVLDMIKDWAHVMMNKMDTETYLNKWKVAEDLFYSVYE